MTYRDIIESIRRDGDVTVATFLEGEKRGEKIRLASSDEAPENCFVESLSEPFRLFILGAGHVGGSLAMLAQHLEFNVWLCDPRHEILHERTYRDNVTLLEADYKTVFRDMDLRATDFLVILTPGHKEDANCLELALQIPLAYRGMIGSMSKVQRTKEKLMTRGIPKEALDTVYAPIGLDIKAQTPYEIAVAILAEMIEVYRTRHHAIIEKDVADAILTATEPLAVCTIIEKRGSGPRGVGTRMLVNGAGERVAGTVGGGAVEAAALRDAAAFLAGSEPLASERYVLSNSDASDLGMVCGGSAVILFEKL